MRAFIAVSLTFEAKKKIKEVQDKLKELPIKVKWVAPKKFHITLKFFADISPERMEEVKKVIASIAGQYSPFNLNLESFGFFPNQNKPRVFFIRAGSGQVLENLAENLEEELEEIGFAKEKRFKPHITLARIKSLKKIHFLTEKISDLKIEGRAKVTKISLYKSNLTPQGPIYKEIFKSSLKN